MKPITHEENRRSVCILCLKKQNIREISEQVRMKIIENYIPDLDLNSWYYPTRICSYCSFALHANDKNRRVELFSYKINIKPNTRSAQVCRSIFMFKNLFPFLLSFFQKECQCEICVAARVNLPNISNFSASKKKRRRPPLSCDPKKPCTLNVCNRCFSEIGRGKPHWCTKVQKHDNMLHILQDEAVDVGDSVVSSYVRNKSPDENSFITLSNQRGLPSHWTQNQACPKKQPLSADDLFLIKKNCNLSTRNTITLSTTLRALDIAVAPNINKELAKLNKRLENYFQVTHLPFEMSGDDKGEKNISLKPVVYCNNVPELIRFVCGERNAKETDYFLKISIDGGGGFLKITLSLVVQKDQNGCSKTGEKNFKSTGVKN